LAATLRAVEHRLDSETQARVEQSLLVLDAAIQETRTALAGDPGSGELIATLTATYDKKLDVLRRLTRLASQG
jgi:hypothetical protein